MTSSPSFDNKPQEEGSACHCREPLLEAIEPRLLLSAQLISDAPTEAAMAALRMVSPRPSYLEATPGATDREYATGESVIGHKAWQGICRPEDYPKQPIGPKPPAGASVLVFDEVKRERNAVDAYLSPWERVIGPTPLPLVAEAGLARPPSPGAVFVPHPTVTDYDWWYGCSPTTGGLQTDWWNDEVQLWDASLTTFAGDPTNWLFDIYPSSNPADFAVPDHANGVITGWAHASDGDTWQGHVPDSIADFMLTVGGGSYADEIEWGMGNYMAWDDLRTPENESWSITTQQQWDYSGWDYDAYKAEIDAGRPVHLWLYSPSGGHSVLGVGYYDPDGPGGQEWIDVYTTWNIGLQEWEWTEETQSGYGFTCEGGMLMDVQPRTTGLAGYFALQHGSISDLTVKIGLGDPTSPLWQTAVWSGGGGDNSNLVLTDIDLEAARPYLATTTDWYLEVYDGASGGQGAIMDFQIRDGNGRWFTYNNGEPIGDFQTSHALIADGPELRGASFATVPASQWGITNTQASFQVANIGTQAAGVFDIGLFWSDDAVFGNGDDIAAVLDTTDPNYDPANPNFFHAAGLASRATLNETVCIVVPGSDPFGTDGQYYLGMIIDIGDDVDEVLESNNRGRGPGIDMAKVDFSPPPAEIHGSKWHDTNQDGTWDEGEPPVADWKIYLDLNGSGDRDLNTQVIPSTDVPRPILDYQTTSSVLEVSGSVADLTDVNVTLDITHTFDGDLDVYLVGPSGTTVELFTDVGSSGQNFTNTTLDDEAAVPIASGSAPFTGSFRPEGLLADFDGENPNGTWTLEVYDASGLDSGTLNSWSITIELGEPSTQTDDNGDYAFAELAPATYTVRELPQAGWTQTYPADGHTVTVGPGETADDVDFGNYASPGAIVGSKWFDVNRNGVWDGGEPALQGWTIYLDLNEDGEFDDGVEPSQVTGADGGYAFTGLTPRRYSVGEVLQDGWEQTCPGLGYLEDFSDGLAQNWLPLVAGNWSVVDEEYRAAAGALDVGMQSMYLGQSWEDFSAEVVMRRNGSETTATVLIVRATDDYNWVVGTGSGYMVGISDGSYYVIKFVSGAVSWLTDGWVDSPYLNTGATPNTVRAELEGSSIEVYFNDHLAWLGADTSVTGPGRIALGGYSGFSVTDHYFDNVRVLPVMALAADAGAHTVVVTAGEIVEDVDFGNYAGGWVEGAKWFDADRDGDWDAGEPALEGWTIYADLDEDGEYDDGEPSAVTGEDGGYILETPAGTYRIREVLQTGWTQTFPAGPDGHLVTLDLGEVITDVDFGNWAVGEIHGAKWLDTDRDGQWDADEPGLAGWTVYLDLDEDGQFDDGVEPSQVTGADGSYAFTNLMPGAYSVGEVLQPGWEQTYSGSGAYEAKSVAFEFIDITTTGSPTMMGADDNYVHLVAANPPAFEFEFYGTTYTDLYFSSNGLITFGSGNSSYTNTDLTSSPSQAAIAPFWDDLIISGGTNSYVYWDLLGSGDSNQLVIQWNDISFLGGSSLGQITYQAVLSERNGSIQFNYLDLASTYSGAEGAEATVGMKDASAQGDNRLLLCYDNGPNQYVGTGKSTRIATAFAHHTIVVAAGEVVEDVDFGNWMAQTTAPGKPDLRPGDVGDTGVYDDDNLTRLDNSSPSAGLQFEIPGTIAGATVTLYADGTPIGSATASGGTTIVTTNGSGDLADGGRSITARQTEPGTLESTDSIGLVITVDTTAPRVSAFGLSSSWSRWKLGVVDSSVWTTAGRAEATAPWVTVDRLVSSFDEPVFTDGGDAAMVGATAGNVPLSLVGGNGTGTLTWETPAFLRTDRYTLSLLSGTDGIGDRAGNLLDGEDGLPSGNGAPGGSWRFDFNVLVGNAIDQPGEPCPMVDTLDRAQLILRLGAVLGDSMYTCLADIAGDGKIDMLDRAHVIINLGKTLPPAPIAAAAPVAPAPAGRFLTGPDGIDMLCDSPTLWPSLVQPTALIQASAAEVDLLGLRPMNLRVIASPLYA